MLKPAEVAEILGVTIVTLARWRQAPPGTGPTFYKVGGRIAYMACDVAKHIRGKRFGTIAEYSDRAAVALPGR